MLAEDTAVAPGEQDAEIVGPPLSTFEPFDADAAVDNIEAERRAEPPETGEPVNTTSDIFKLSVDDLPFVSQADEPSRSDRAEDVEPALNIVDAPSPEEVSPGPVLELPPDTFASAVETTLPDPAVLTLDDAALTFMDENVPPTQPSREPTATAGDATPADALTSPDMLVLEDSPESMLPEDLIVELGTPDTGPQEGVTPLDALAPGELDDAALPGHLTLELDTLEIMAHESSMTLDDVRLDDPPGDVQSTMSPPHNQTGDEEDLLLDVDDFEFDDDAQA